MSDYKDFNDQVIAEFRANGGQVGGQVEGAPLLLLHSTGARSGQPRIHPMMYLQDEDRYVVFASKAGADTHPDWYEMLAIVEGTAQVEQGGTTVAQVGPGDVIGEMGVIGRGQRNATVTATSPMLLIALDHWDFAKLRKSVPKIVERLTAVIAARQSG